MAINDLGPWYVSIEYQSSGGPHTMLRPTTEWVGVPFVDAGVFVNHNGVDVAAATAITSFVTLMLPIMNLDTEFTSWTVYSKPTPTSQPLPVATGMFTGMVGTVSSTTQWLTYEKIYTFRTESGGIARVNLLDAPTGGTISKERVVIGAELALVNEFMDQDSIWVGRDGARPALFRSLSNGVNDALKRAYRL
jgi:hypothetical protein